MALVFGNETKGLSNEDVAPPHARQDSGERGVFVPQPGAAVQVLCYELRMAALDPGAAPGIEFEPATHEQIEGFTPTSTGRSPPAASSTPPTKRLWPRLRRLFGRIRLEKDEVNILRGMLSAFEKK